MVLSREVHLLTAFQPAFSTAIELAAALPSRLAPVLAFAPNNGLLHYLKTMQDTDQTFKQAHHIWNWFDATMLIPYSR
jgi:hypothetical protein